jgi:hypothetical protein
MLGSLRIVGFRAFPELSVERLGRVTLVVGRNNVGKTTLLEAVHLHASDVYVGHVAHQILERRDEYLEGGTVVDLERLFHRRNGSSAEAATISDAQGDRTLELTTAWSWWEADDDGKVPREGHSPPEGIAAERVFVMRRHRAGAGGWHRVPSLPLSRSSADLALRRPKLHGSPSLLLPSSGFRTDAIDIADLWDDVALTEREERVIDMLRVVEPDLERITMVKAGRAGRTAAAKLQGRSRLPLRSLGDGMNRLLEMALGLATVGEGGSFLVDEIDSGLHFTTLVEVWRLVFDAAARFDVQVLATTHSWDCIEAFQEAAANHPAEGVLVRLQRAGEVFGSEVFSEDDLAIITRESIEVR